MENEPILIVRAKESDFLITKDKDYLVYDFHYDKSEDNIYLHLVHDSNMRGRINGDNFILVKDLR